MIKLAKYLARADLERPLVGDDPEGIDQVVVIPALAEEERLFACLASLAANPARERRQTLVICVINNRAEPHCSGTEIANNARTLDHLAELVAGRESATVPRLRPGDLQLAYIDASGPGREIDQCAGVGEARRIGLDRGVALLAGQGRIRGLLYCLDADTVVAADYFQVVREQFLARRSWAAVVAYEHPLPEGQPERAAIIGYELFLRYHELGLGWAGSPYAYPPIGSTMVCRGDAYVAAGGMNRRQAGEDFYFLQQLAKTGGVDRITGTTVYPSPRVSHRVPFGTGASVRQQLAGERDPTAVYHPESYRILRAWLRAATGNLAEDAPALLGEARRIAPALGDFLVANRFARVWPRLQQHAADQSGLVAQFHRWFDAFKTLKLIHHLRDSGLARQPIMTALPELPCTGPELATALASASNPAADIDARAELLIQIRRACRDSCGSTGWPRQP